MAARRHDSKLADFANRLTAAGKPPKLAIVAVMRKLIEATNLVLKRQAPWTT
jgi:transposase